MVGQSSKVPYVERGHNFSYLYCRYCGGLIPQHLQLWALAYCSEECNERAAGAACCMSNAWGAPKTLEDVPDLRRFGIAGMKAAYVYFLVSRKKIVYVGQTLSGLEQRISAHLADPSKTFDDVFYICVDSGSVSDIERYYIRTLRPKHNRVFL